MNSLNIILVVYAAFIAVTGVHGESDICDRICPETVQPTCGTDGIEYVKFDNFCEMRVFNCKRLQANLATYYHTDLDWCTTTELKDNSALFSEKALESGVCMRPCPLILKPVCASDGTYRTTFSNDCEMQMFNCLSTVQKKNGWKLLKSSSC